MITFDKAFDRLIGHEGGFSIDPKDPGNWTGGKPGIGLLKGTKFGIAANTYPDLDIRNLTVDQARAIYYRDWWTKIGGESIDSAILFQVWDFAVNAGMSTAKKALQRAVKVTDDGAIGPATIAAVKALPVASVVLRFNAQRLRFYTSLSTWGTYGKGWTNRVAADLDFGADDTL